MYAIVEIAGQQFKVEAGRKIFVHRLEEKEGSGVEFDNVLLIEDDGKITIGEPTIKGAVVEGKILEHMRGDKVIVFKKKRKKGYRVKNGHRQNMTHVEIMNISAKGGTKKTAAKKEETKPAEAAVSEPVKEEKPAAVKAASAGAEATEKKAPAKKPAEKKPAEKKTAEKKPAAKKPAAKKTAVKKPAKDKEE
ncbi:MAG TPA: 50S ribosomal protein L21 [Bacteroidales bacterium]|nr:50S ribosomal protein L21 [Bacteroidales bacterium]